MVGELGAGSLHAVEEEGRHATRTRPALATSVTRRQDKSSAATPESTPQGLSPDFEIFSFPCPQAGGEKDSTGGAEHGDSNSQTETG